MQNSENQDEYKYQRKKCRNKNNKIGTNERYMTDQIIRSKKKQATNNVFCGPHRARNRPNKESRVEKRAALSLWIKTAVLGDMKRLLVDALAKLNMLPHGQVMPLWQCLHVEIKSLSPKSYEWKDCDALRSYIYESDVCHKNDDAAVIYLSKTYHFNLHIFSLDQDFKAVKFENREPVTIKILHLGYDNFTSLVHNNTNKCYKLTGNMKKHFAKLNSPVSKSANKYQIEKEKKLLLTLREMLQGMEHAQDMADTPKKGSTKKPYYEVYSMEQLNESETLKICTLRMENAHFATATIINRGNEKFKEISLMSRKSCGYNAFEGDTVYVEINDPDIFTGKVVGVKHSYHKPIDSIYVCKVCRDQGSLMTPLDKSFPKIHVDNEPGRRRYEKELKARTERVFKEEQKSLNIRQREFTSHADNIYVSIFHLEIDSASKRSLFRVLRVENFDPETCDKLFLVYYEYWDVSSMYPNGKVVGMISTYDSFKDTLHLILPLCKVEPTVINDIYKKEIESIRKKVKEIEDIPHDIVPKGAMVFTIDNEETQDMDDALSYHVKDGGVVIGVHISDITKYISPEHEVYKQAQRRFSTAYTPSHLGEEPIYLIEKELTTDCFSLVRNKPRAVLSVMFHFPKEGGPLPGSVTFGETFIKSKYKLSYKEVEGWIKETNCPRDMEEDLFIAIKGCYEKARMIRRGRLPISYFVRQSNYNKPGMQFDDNFNAQFLIEEFMIMANEHVAKKIYESYPNMGLIRVQDPVVDYQEWENRLFELSNLNFPSSLGQCCNLLGIRRSNENHKDLVVSRQYYDDFVKFLKEDLNKARNMISYDVYINDFYLHLSEWHRICNPARYECSLEGCVENRHFSLDKDIYTHFTSPIRRFSDVIVHMMLKSVLHGNKDAYGLDERMVSEVCIIANERIKTIKLFEKYCAPYDIFEATPSIYNFVLDCICSDITNEELHFVHRSLERSAFKKSIKFSHLSLNVSPVQLKVNESSTLCTLMWKKKLFSESSLSNRSPKNIFQIDNHLYDVKLSHRAHELFREIRLSEICLPVEELKNKLTALKRQFIVSVNESDMVISSNFSANPIIEIHLQLFIKNTVRIQFCSYKVNGFKRVNPQLLIVHPSFQLCLIHHEDPVMCFVSGGKIHLEHNDILWKFNTIREYKNYFLPLLQLESLEEIMKEKSEFTLQDISLKWMNVKSPLTHKEERFGIIDFNLTCCERANIEFSDESDKVAEDYDTIINEGLWSPTGDLVCIRGKRKHFDNYWVGHGVVVNVRKFSNTDVKTKLKVIVFMLTQSDFDISDDCTTTFAVEVYFRLISSRRQITAVSSIQKNRFLKQLIFGRVIDSDYADQSMVERVLNTFHEQSEVALNAKQTEALTKALTLKFSLIWGPPGTGKTTIGCVLAFCFCVKNHNDGVVLYCGPSNECVNLVIHSMEQKFNKHCPKMLRIFSKQQELADFPLPGHFTKAVPLLESLKKICLHHLIRDLSTEAGAELRQFDSIFEKIIKSPDTFREKDHDGKSVYQLIYQYKKIVNQAKEEYIRQSNSEMVLCTTSVAGSKIIELFHVKQVIIDEAGMCKEPETLVPISKSCKTVESVVLIGDHKQLRPIINHDLASKRGLQISLFERYQRLRKEYVTMLNQQYRMHPSICEFPSKSFYHDELQTEPSKKWSGLQDSDFEEKEYYSNWNGIDYTFAKPNFQECLDQSGYSAIPDHVWPGQRMIPFTSLAHNSVLYPERLVFIDIVGDEIVQAVSTLACGENSRANLLEVEVVGYIYDKLISRWPNPTKAVSHVAVLTQYRLQESLLLAECKQKLALRKIKADPIVKTVIKSQGSESDYVIFSTVRSLRNKDDILKNPTPGWENKYLGFITDKNQVNVALTRAQKGLIIIGNKGLLSANSMWKSLLDDLETRGCIVSNYLTFI